MRFLVDENVPRRIVRTILGRYPGSISVAENPRFQGHSDDELYGFLRRNPYSFLTFDADFSNILRYPPAKTKGIVVVRPKGMNIDASEERLLACLSAVNAKLLSGSLVVITKKSIRTKLAK